jgi:hypothetical protein
MVDMFSSRVAPLILIGLFCLISFTSAVERVDKPFKYFLSTIDISIDTAYWGVTPTFLTPDILINKEGTDGFNRVGTGIDYGRYVKSSNGKVFETLGTSIFVLIQKKGPIAIGGNVHILNRYLGIGGGAEIDKLKFCNPFICLTTGLRIF